MHKRTFLTLLIILSTIFLIPASLAERPEEIELTGYVNDYAGILSQVEKEELTSVLKRIHDSGKAEVAVVTIRTLEGYDETTFAHEVADGNLGDEEANNGLLILVALEERRYRIEVGRGLEPYFNDAKVGRMGRNILVPAFKMLEYGEGLIEVVNEIELQLEEGPIVPKTAAEKRMDLVVVGIVYFIFIGLIVLAIFVRFNEAKKYVNKKRGGKIGKYHDEEIFFAGLMGAHLMRGGRGRGGNLGGGFGGFGGGGFGGGGAGGGW